MLFNRRLAQLLQALQRGRIRDCDLHEPEEKIQVKRSFRLIERPDTMVRMYKSADSLRSKFQTTPKQNKLDERKLDISAGRMTVSKSFCVQAGAVGVTTFLEEMSTEISFISEKHCGQIQQTLRGHQHEIFTREFHLWKSKLPNNFISEDDLMRVKMERSGRAFC